MPSPNPPSNLGLLLTLGWSIAVWMTAGMLLGLWVDARFSLYPWGTVTGTLAAIGGCVLTLANTLRKLDQKKDD